MNSARANIRGVEHPAFCAAEKSAHGQFKMKHKIIAINGESYCRELTGIERLAFETVSYLDEKFSPGCAELVVPKNARNVPCLSNIKVVTLPVEANFFPKWNQIHFQKYVLKNRRIPLDFSNSCPYFAPGFDFIHDIYAHLCKDDYGHSLRDKLIRLYSEIMYRRIAKKSKLVFTVSEYTKQTIVESYKIDAERVRVVYAGVGEIRDIPADNSIFDSLPKLRGTEFYFTLGSLSTRKNLKWIVRHAQLFPNELFVVSGKPLPSVVAPELRKLEFLDNVVMAGYLSDAQVQALMRKCKAFVFPSYFEGFGIPPLEALAFGAKIVISDRTSLPEIYGDCAYYIDPDEPDVDLDALLKTPVAPPDALLKKFTLRNTAERIYDALAPFLRGN